MKEFRNTSLDGGQRMKIRYTLIAAALAIVCAAALAAGGRAQEKETPAKSAGSKAPKAVVDEMKADVGEVLEVQDIEHTFIVKNEGNADLKILNVKPGCGCSVADFDKVIPPGGEGKIRALIYGAKISPGNLDKSFYVTTNDPANEKFTLVIEGKVSKTFDFSRDLRWAGFTDEPLKIESVVTDLLDTPVDVTSARWDDESKAKGIDTKFSLKLETIAKGHAYRLTIAKKGDLAPDDFVARVILATDNPKLPEKIVPVSITVLPDVAIHPPTLYYGDMTNPPGATQAFERTFTIVAARGDSLKVLKAVSNRDDMTVKIQEGVPGKSFKGTVFVRPPSKVERYSGTITITTNYPKYRELTLGVVGSVRSGGEGASKGKK
jgi:hypothetical protein